MKAMKMNGKTSHKEKLRSNLDKPDSYISFDIFRMVTFHTILQKYRNDISFARLGEF